MGGILEVNEMQLKIIGVTSSKQQATTENIICENFFFSVSHMWPINNNFVLHNCASNCAHCI